ncbi:replication protein A1, small [Babesia caballi]|uniref:Replication protein A1, small n=1 Tax=Babesia caballi TaxID=5871 RepID=A0AAV4LN12_BABCB|nr:replication protein A1, small [Babesia caballi]
MELTYFPIKDITTYTSKWTIKARVLEKLPLRQLKGDNHLLQMDVVDKNVSARVRRVVITLQGDSIRIKFWGKAAVKWDEVVQQGEVYTFSGGSVDLANKKYNRTPHKYEITCYHDSVIERVEDAGDITSQRDHALLTIRDIKTMGDVTPAPIDILCIVNSVQPASSLKSKAGRDIVKRVITVVDDSGYEMEMVLWASHANMEGIEEMEGKPMLASRVTIKEWQGARNIQSTTSSEIRMATPENFRDSGKLSQLQAWYDEAKAKNEAFRTLKPQPQTTRDNYELVDVATLQAKTKGNFSVNAKLRKIFWKNKEGAVKLWYQACPMCSKKVIMDPDTSRFTCISCGDASVTPVTMYFFHCVFMDHTGKINAQVMAEIGDKVVGKPATDLVDWDQDKIKHVCDVEATHKDYKVSGYLKVDTYNGETRYKFHVNRVNPLDYAAEAALMLESMQITYDDVLRFLEIGTDEREVKRVKTE